MPIIPDYLYQLEHHRSADDSFNTITATTFTSNISTTSSPSVTAATLSHSPFTPSSFAHMEGKEVRQKPFTATHRKARKRELFNEGGSVGSSIYSPSFILQKPLRNSEGHRRDDLSNFVGTRNFAASDLTQSRMHQTSHKWRVGTMQRPLPLTGDELRRRVRKTSGKPFEKLESEQRTPDQRTVRAGSIRRFPNVQQTSDGSSQEPLVTQERVLPLSWSHRAPSSSQAPKQVQNPQENKLPTSPIPGESRKREIFEDISSENWKVGLLLSSKALVQLIVNPMVGSLTSHIGYSLPLVFGTHNLLLSAIRECLISSAGGVSFSSSLASLCIS